MRRSSSGSTRRRSPRRGERWPTDDREVIDAAGYWTRPIHGTVGAGITSLIPLAVFAIFVVWILASQRALRSPSLFDSPAVAIAIGIVVPADRRRRRVPHTAARDARRPARRSPCAPSRSAASSPPARHGTSSGRGAKGCFASTRRGPSPSGRPRRGKRRCGRRPFRPPSSTWPRWCCTTTTPR